MGWELFQENLGLVKYENLGLMDTKNDTLDNLERKTLWNLWLFGGVSYLKYQGWKSTAGCIPGTF